MRALHVKSPNAVPKTSTASKIILNKNTLRDLYYIVDKTKHGMQWQLELFRF